MKGGKRNKNSKKEIKSEVTAEMIKDFQNENAKPVEVNGVLYKFRPPEVDIDLQDIPPEFPDLETYRSETQLALPKMSEQSLKAHQHH